MERVVLAGEYRAGESSPVANRDHIVERLANERQHRLAERAGPVDADLAQDRLCFRVHRSGLGSGRERLKVGAAELLEQGLGHLASGRVAGAYEEDAKGIGPRSGALVRTGGSTGRLDRRFEIGQLGVQPIEVGSLTFDCRALAADERHQVVVDLTVFDAQRCQATGIRRRETQATQGDDQPQAREIAFGVFAVLRIVLPKPS